MIKIHDDERETVFINPEHVVAVIYRKKSDVVSVDAELTISTTKYEITYDGEVAEAVFENIYSQTDTLTQDLEIDLAEVIIEPKNEPINM